MKALFAEVMIFVALAIIILAGGPINLWTLFSCAIGWFGMGLVLYLLGDKTYRS